MYYVAIVTVLALAQFLWFGIVVAQARGRYGVAAPAVTGNETFERHFRIHANTLEQLIVFLPLLWVFASFVSPVWAAAGGLLFVVGRAIYARAYLRDPQGRTIGFVLTATPSLVFMIGILCQAVRGALGF